MWVRRLSSTCGYELFHVLTTRIIEFSFLLWYVCRADEYRKANMTTHTRAPKRTLKGPVKDKTSPFVGCIPVYTYQEIQNDRIPQYIEYYEDRNDGVTVKLVDLKQEDCVGRVETPKSTWVVKVFNSRA
jgi:hypothetical protein